jgi:hypothetical protein
MSKEKHEKHRNSTHLCISPFPPIFVNHIVSLSQKFPFSPLQALAIPLERTEEEKETWKKLVHCEEDPRTEFKE